VSHPSLSPIFHAKYSTMPHSAETHGYKVRS
jgi:hypothetical protein